MKKWLIIFILVLFYQEFLAQNNDMQIGNDPTFGRRSMGAFYDLSEPNAVNIKVSVWGYVRYPGKYLVPDYTTVKDLISYAGGPQDGAQLEDIRLLKTLPDSSSTMLKFDYNDLLWGKELTTKYINTPRLGVGDILLIPGAPRLSFRDYWQISLSIISTLVSITVLVVNLTKK
jgi:hypothetical protein